MQVSKSEWESFYANMKRRTGLDLHLYRANQLQRRIISMAENKGFKTVDEFWGWIGQSGENITWFCDRLAINVSELFRNPEKWVEMENKILPDLLSRSPRLKIWSAGCSYGAEAHTLAMVLHDKFPGAHQIIGTDIDEAALSQAKRGEFSESDVRCVPANYKKYLYEKDKSWFAKDEIKKPLRFSKQNLLADRFDTGFDMIMCRNVVIYFTDEAKSELYKRFYQSLKPGGILFVGSTERVFQANDLGLITAHPFFYQKPLLEAKSWRNAS